ncbi:MAG: FAD-dependent oxidoreductase [Oscillospiraceae bacterium]|nr:FAD-dependent oxidoreductase [Oscillospiraceae bacterium]
MRYDVAIIGGGIAGLMAAWRLTDGNSGLKVVILEQGNALDRRYCPMVEKKQALCSRCASCAIMEGLGGAGAFSDGKYVITSEYGGWLTDVLSSSVVLDYIEQADSILRLHGAPDERYLPDDELKTICLQNDLHMQQGQLKHLGTDANLSTMKSLVKELSSRCILRTGVRVTGADPKTHTVFWDENGQPGSLSAENVLFAAGRAGSEFFADWCRKNDVSTQTNAVDIGVRVELPALTWDHFSSRIYEPKILYRSRRYGDITRMFCFNERGHVVLENTSGILTVNGHAYKDKAKKSANSNFALLTTLRFTEPFNEPIRFAKSVASLANMLSGGGVLIQLLGDLRSGRRSTEERVRACTTEPTLRAVPGDLSLCLPKRQLDNILETLDALNVIAPGTANHDTLLYGVECKYYSSRPCCNDFEICSCPGFYAAGDGSGFTRSLSHAAANGLYVADKILSKG